MVVVVVVAVAVVVVVVVAVVVVVVVVVVTHLMSFGTTLLLQQVFRVRAALYVLMYTYGIM